MQPFFLSLTNFEAKWWEMLTAAVALPVGETTKEDIERTRVVSKNCRCIYDSTAANEAFRITQSTYIPC
jgi:hypothetical protein